jgi:hypothetical protein
MALGAGYGALFRGFAGGIGCGRGGLGGKTGAGAPVPRSGSAPGLRSALTGPAPALLKRFPLQHRRPIPVPPDMPDPPLRPDAPPGEGLLHPFHNSGKLQPILRLHIEHKPVILKTQDANLEDKPEPRLPEHTGKKRPGPVPSEQGLPIVDTGTNFVPHTLFEFTQRSHTHIFMGLSCRFALIRDKEK